MANRARVKWVRKLEFLFTEIGYMIGLGNIWRFPYRCYIYGGGTFLIPYLLTVVLCTIPVLFLEVFLGQFASAGAITIWNICPLFRGIGWAIMFNTFMICIYYSVIVMYSSYYMMVSFVNIGGDLPWKDCGQKWNTHHCRDVPFPDIDKSSDNEQEKIEILRQLMNPECVVLNNTEVFSYYEFKEKFQHCMIKYTSPEEEYWNHFVLGVHTSEGFDDLGPVHGRNAMCLLFVWLFVFYCCLRGVRSIAKATYFTATFPVLLLVVLFVRGLTLEGSWNGLQYYTTPNWEKLSDMAIWYNAAAQAVYSSGIAYGSHIVLASYNQFNNNLIRDGFILGLSNSFISIFGGSIVFSFLGHASLILNRPVDQMVDNGPGLIFIAYIRGMTKLPGSAVWCFLFFMMVFTLGLDSLFVHTWTLYVCAADVLPEAVSRRGKWLLLATCVCLFFFGLPITTYGGIHLLVVIDNYAAQVSILVCIIAECVAVCWIYGIENFMDDIDMMIGMKPWVQIFKRIFRVTWRYTVPLYCLFIVIASCISFTKPNYNGKDTTTSGEVIGWMMTSAPFVLIVVFGTLEVVRRGPVRRDTILRLIKSATVPLDCWGPHLEGDRTGRYARSKDNEYITPCTDLEMETSLS